MNTNRSFVGFAQLKQSVSMDQILTRYGLLDRLRRSGDNLSGVCPIHDGHNNTQFRVSISRNCWICFGDCQAGGSIIDFVSRKEGVGIREAALLIQEWFRLQPLRNGRLGSKHALAQSVTLPKWTGQTKPAANAPLRFTLANLDSGHHYLAERGLTPETIKAFGLGYCTKGTLAGWIAIPIHNTSGKTSNQQRAAHKESE